MNSRKLPPEADQLLWAAAESSNPNVRAEFERRYPHLRAQLATRTAMVDVLRKSKPTAADPALFRAPGPDARPRYRMFALVPAAAILLGGLAFGAYKVAQSFMPVPTKHRALHEAAAPNVVPPGPPMSFGPAGGAEDSLQPGEGPRPQVNEGHSGIVELRSSGMTLLQALALVAERGKISINVMPGVKDVSLTLAPDNPEAVLALPALEMLKVLERLAPIHVVDAGPEGFLVLPIEKVRNVEPRAPSSPAGGPSAAGGQ